MTEKITEFRMKQLEAQGFQLDWKEKFGRTYYAVYRPIDFFECPYEPESAKFDRLIKRIRTQYDESWAVTLKRAHGKLYIAVHRPVEWYADLADAVATAEAQAEGDQSDD